MNNEKCHVCLNCNICFDESVFEKMDTNIISCDDYEYYLCPVEDCGGKITLIDRNIVDTILILKKKGYTITNYNEGNPKDYENCIRITFREDYNFETLPESFKIEYEEINSPWGNFIERVETSLLPSEIYIDCIGITERRQEYLKLYANLLKWAEELPISKNVIEKTTIIDKSMLDIILILNKKGYPPIDCNKGNPKECNDYIKLSFAEDYNFETLPEGFNIESQIIKFSIKRKMTLLPLSPLLTHIENMTIAEKHRAYLKLYEKLLKWAKELPINENKKESA